MAAELDEVCKKNKNQRCVPDPWSELLHQGGSVALSACLCQCTFYIDHLGPEGRGPLRAGVGGWGGGGLLPPLRDGWLYTKHSQQSAHLLSPTRYQSQWQILLNDFGEDKRRLIDTTYDLHVTVCMC